MTEISNNKKKIEGFIHAQWITGDYTPSKKQRYPVDCFAKTFTVPKAAKSAALNITACGLYEAHINGKRIGNAYFTPGFTDYNKRLYYHVYDVAALLQQGDNSITVELTDGWYRGSIGAMGIRNVYGKETKLLAQLEIVYEDGTSEIVATDDSWEWSNDGAWRFADM
jgi:alpha-L-rhamnosidase